jgi:hypothetical protein
VFQKIRSSIFGSVGFVRDFRVTLTSYVSIGQMGLPGFSKPLRRSASTDGTATEKSLNMKNKKALCLRVHNASDGDYAKLWTQWINVSKPAVVSGWHIQRQEGPAVIWNHHYTAPPPAVPPLRHIYYPIIKNAK